MYNVHICDANSEVGNGVMLSVGDSNENVLMQLFSVGSRTIHKKLYGLKKGVKKYRFLLDLETLRHIYIKRYFLNPHGIILFKYFI